MLDFFKEILESAESYFKENNMNIHVEYKNKNFISDEFPEVEYLILSSYALHHIREVKDLEGVYKKIEKWTKSFNSIEHAYEWGVF